MRPKRTGLADVATTRNCFMVKRHARTIYHVKISQHFSFPFPQSSTKRLRSVLIFFLHCSLQLRWHMGMAQVGEVQPTPIPTKTIPAVGFTHTCTVDPQVSVTPRVTHKPIWVCRNFLIFHGSVLFFCVFFFLNIIFFCFLVLYLLYNTVAT